MSTTPEQIVDEVTGALIESAPHDWARIQVKVWYTVLARQFEMSVSLHSGIPAEMAIPTSVKNGFTKLRPLMYEPDRGTWFSATLVLNSADQRELSFNYDEDPQWWPDLPPVMYSSDLAEFPRSENNIPDWLREKLAQAALDGHSAEHNG